MWIETEIEWREIGDAIVTPYAGVWIETLNLCIAHPSLTSLPTRECGLKPENTAVQVTAIIVTPYAGVWIETARTCP